MKRTIILLISLLLMICDNIRGNLIVTERNLSSSDSIRVLSSPDLYNLSIKWAGEYNKLFPETKIKVISVSDTKMVNKLLEKGDIGFVSNEYYSGFANESTWKVVVGRDVIVPVINSKNPYLDEISEKGISPESFALFLNNRDSRKWGTLLKGDQNSSANFYCINDGSISNLIAGFLKTDKNKIDGIKVENAEELLSAIKKDPYAIGFCKMINILNLKNQTLAENIRLLPIDRNGNGLIDYNEKIYDDFNDFSRGVWIGKYPKALISNIYSVSSNQPKSETEVAFLKWILSDGQQYLYTNGYSDLLISERQTTTDKLYNTRAYISATTEDEPLLKAILVILAVIILTGFLVDFVVKYLRRKKTSEHIAGSAIHPVLDENSLVVPGGLYFDKTHTWAFMEQNGVVKVGIDDFIQHITGTLTRIRMKNEGDKIKKGEPILSLIQNGKQLNLYSPISGIIKEKNNTLNTNASMLNSSPYNDGWVYRIEPTNWLRENQLLFMADKHKQFVKNEFTRLKDFLAVSLKEDTEKYAQVILQDGGELIDSTLANLGPEVWEDFQSKFIDPSRQIWFYELF
jgi:glycine cleavage system H lipoate-binding protein/ABC-type phosphate transport system substrate-binding protein